MPVPRFFRESGLFDNANILKFVTWAFSECSLHKQKVTISGFKVVLEPFEFHASRYQSFICRLTPDKFRKVVDTLIKAEVLIKTEKSVEKKFNIYSWNIKKLSAWRMKNSFKANTEIIGINFLNPERKDPWPFQYKKKRKKKITFSKEQLKEPSFSKIDSLADDAFDPKNVEKNPETCPPKIKDAPPKISKNKVFKIYFLNKKKLKKRVPKFTLDENEKIAKKISMNYKEFGTEHFYRALYIDNERTKQKGVYFQNQSPYITGFFVSVTNPDFKKKVSEFIRVNKMQKSIIKSY